MHVLTTTVYISITSEIYSVELFAIPSESFFRGSLQPVLVLIELLLFLTESAPLDS